MAEVVKKFVNKAATIGVIGLGYVGLPLAIRLAQAGFKVVGFDVDQAKISALKQHQSYIKPSQIIRLVRLVITAFFPHLITPKLAPLMPLFYACHTPLDKYREPDLSYVFNTIDTILPYLKPQQLLSLESTTYPGTTEEEIVTRIAKTGFNVGEDFYVVYSPEREDPGNKKFSIENTPKIVGGYTAKCCEVGVALYQQIINKVVTVSSAKTAEMVKLLENIHRSVNIGLINEMKIIADKMGIDIYEVVNAAASKPFGFIPYYPGPGVGGHCIPIDPFYLTWKAREYGVHTRFIELAGEINRSMPEYVVQKVVEGLNRFSKSLKGCRVLVLGISYKKNVDDARESPSVEIMRLLDASGALVSYSDPYWPNFPKMRKYSFGLESVGLTPAMLTSFDCVVIATDHDNFDYELVKQHAKLIVDTRGVFTKNCSDKVIRA